MSIGFLFIKILNRIKILRYFNFFIKTTFNNRPYLIPVLKGIGLSNLYEYKDYDFYVYNYFKHEIQSGAFIDVGANLGQTVLKILSLHNTTHIFSVEPNYSCLNYLEELKRVNHFDQITLIPAALFDTTGIKKLFTLNPTDTSASLINDNRPGFFKKDEFILINAIDGVQLQSLITEKITFIKIDVEGAELHVLSAIKEIIMKHTPIIYCEVLDAHNQDVLEQNNLLKGEILNFVRNVLNYSIFNLQGNSLIEIKTFPSGIFNAENLDSCNYIFMKEL